MNSDAMEIYSSYLESQPVSIHTKRNYVQRVRRFLRWLNESPDGVMALTDPPERERQLRDYKAFLLARGASASTINGMLSALDNFFMSRGMEAGRVKRLELPGLNHESLDVDEEKRLYKSLMRNTSRNKVLVMLLWHCGLKISEVAALNVGDVNLSSNNAQIRICSEKRTKRRTVPISSQLRRDLHAYIARRGFRDSHEPLFVSQKRNRLSVASIDRIVRYVGQAAGIELSAGRLRYDFVNRLIRAKINIVMVAELSGHVRLETVRRYSQQVDTEKQQSLEKAFSCNPEALKVDDRE